MGLSEVESRYVKELHFDAKRCNTIKGMEKCNGNFLYLLELNEGVIKEGILFYPSEKLTYNIEFAPEWRRNLSR